MIATDELIIDSFAGGGGASLGMEMALGRPRRAGGRMTTPICNLHPHNRALPPAPPCPICAAPPVERTCGCCGATCLVPPCPLEHRKGNPTTIDTNLQDGLMYCDDCALDCPPIGGYRRRPEPAPAEPPAPPTHVGEQLDLFGGVA